MSHSKRCCRMNALIILIEFLLFMQLWMTFHLDVPHFYASYNRNFIPQTGAPRLDDFLNDCSASLINRSFSMSYTHLAPPKICFMLPHCASVAPMEVKPRGSSIDPSKEAWVCQLQHDAAEPSLIYFSCVTCSFGPSRRLSKTLAFCLSPAPAPVHPVSGGPMAMEAEWISALAGGRAPF